MVSVKRKEEDENFEEKRLNLGIKESELEPDWPPVRRESWRHGNERENQPTPRSRGNDLRPDISDRRFNRGRTSPVRRYVSIYRDVSSRSTTDVWSPSHSH